VYLANFKETKHRQTQTKRKTSAKEKYEPSPGGFHLLRLMFSSRWQICPGLNANAIQIPHDKYHKKCPH